MGADENQEKFGGLYLLLKEEIFEIISTRVRLRN